MKKTINGITYDTDTAAAFGEVLSKSLNRAGLYRTQDGHFFLYECRWYADGRRLPFNMQMDDFASGAIIRVGDRPSFTERCSERHFLTPLSREGAFRWAIRHLLPRCFHTDLRAKGVTFWPPEAASHLCTDAAAIQALRYEFEP